MLFKKLASSNSIWTIEITLWLVIACSNCCPDSTAIPIIPKVSIENDGEDEFFEVAFPGKPTWEKICVSALFHDDVVSQSIIDFVNNTCF